MEQFKYLDQFYFDYSVHLVIKLVSEDVNSNWEFIRDILEKCKLIITGGLEYNTVNKQKAFIFLAMVYLQKLIREEEKGDITVTVDDIQELDHCLRALYNVAQQDEFKNIVNSVEMKDCLVKVLQYKIQRCTSSNLSKSEKDAKVAETLEALSQLGIRKKKKMPVLKVKDFIQLCTKAITNLYKKFETPYIVQLVKECQDKEVNQEFLELVTESEAILLSDVDEAIAELGGDSAMDIVPQIKNEIQANLEAKESLSVHLKSLSALSTENQHVLSSSSYLTATDKEKNENVPKSTSNQVKHTASVHTQTDPVMFSTTLPNPSTSTDHPPPSLPGCSACASHVSASPKLSVSASHSLTSSDLSTRRSQALSGQLSSLDSSALSKYSVTTNHQNDSLQSVDQCKTTPLKRGKKLKTSSPKKKLNSGREAISPSSLSEEDEPSTRESVFKATLPSIQPKASLMNFQRSFKPPSHSVGIHGKWSGEEEESLIKHTLLIGAGSWQKIKEAMGSLRSTQQLKDKWRNVPNHRKIP